MACSSGLKIDTPHVCTADHNMGIHLDEHKETGAHHDVKASLSRKQLSKRN